MSNQFNSQYQIAKFLRNFPKTSYGNIDLTDAGNVQTLTDNGFVFGDFTDEDYTQLTYTGVEGYTGTDSSMIGSTAYAKRARPTLINIAYQTKLPAFVEEDLNESEALKQKVGEMKEREQVFIAEGKKYGGWDNMVITAAMSKFFNN